MFRKDKFTKKGVKQFVTHHERIRVAKLGRNEVEAFTKETTKPVKNFLVCGLTFSKKLLDSIETNFLRPLLNNAKKEGKQTTHGEKDFS